MASTFISKYHIALCREAHVKLNFKNISLKNIAYFLTALLILFLVIALLMLFTIKNHINTSYAAWQAFQERVIEKKLDLDKIDSNLGYGGMIHNFKNYVLRGEDKYYKEALKNIDNSKQAISAYLAVQHTGEEAIYLETVRQMLDYYQRGLHEDKKIVGQKKSITEIDNVFRFDHASSQLALKKLKHYIAERTKAERKKLEQSLVTVGNYAVIALWIIIICGLVLGALFIYVLTKLIIRPFQATIKTADNISLGNYAISDEITGFREARLLRETFLNMIQMIERQIREQTQLAEISGKLAKQTDLDGLASLVTATLAEWVDAKCIALFFKKEKDSSSKETSKLYLFATYAYKKRKNIDTDVKPGEGLVGQCMIEKKPIILTQVPEDYIHIQSSLGEKVAKSIYVLPILFNDELLGVIELASLGDFSQEQQDFLEILMGSLALYINNLRSATAVKEALQKSNTLNEELQTQQEELRVSNEKLEEKTRVLKESEEELRAQSEELRVMNEELEEKTERLEQQKNELEVAQKDLRERAEELALSSKYKSEFLANMSHELRTPLNSLLILSKKLSDNKEGNLTEKQVKSASVIYRGGQDLLTLINDILDLSKVEAGKMQLEVAPCDISSICENLDNQFKPLITEKGLAFKLDIGQEIPKQFESDEQRIIQVLRNFISNAFKFTEEGSVTIRVSHPDKPMVLGGETLEPNKIISWSVIDTGIGIPKDKQRLIFEAFQQAEGSTSRKYGGTGLGLAISRAMTQLMGGDITLESEEGKGSIFSLSLPLSPSENNASKQTQAKKEPVSGEVSADIIEKQPASSVVNSQLHQEAKPVSYTGKLKLLVVEDDVDFRDVIAEFADDKEYEVLKASTGREALEIAKRERPSAIVLDLGLPDMDGVKVLEQLKDDLETRHIPVHVISGRDEDLKLMNQGAIGYLKKPATEDSLSEVFNKFESVMQSGIKTVLLVEDDKDSQLSINELIDSDKIDIHSESDAQGALSYIDTHSVGCIILDLNLPDMTGFELLEILHEKYDVLPPIVIYTGRELSREEHDKLQRYTSSIVVKGVNSPDRLLDEVTLFLHSVETDLSNKSRKVIKMLHSGDETLSDKKILLVDDDMRNVFALSSELEEYNLNVVIASNGQQALEKLNETENNDIKLILMDVMMPVMDGFTAMEHIRNDTKFKELPIIALTAKAMPGDKEKCLQAGASDYIAKPIDVDQLVSMMKVWMPKS